MTKTNTPIRANMSYLKFHSFMKQQLTLDQVEIAALPPFLQSDIADWKDDKPQYYELEKGYFTKPAYKEYYDTIFGKVGISYQVQFSDCEATAEINTLLDNIGNSALAMRQETACPVNSRHYKMMMQEVQYLQQQAQYLHNALVAFKHQYKDFEHETPTHTIPSSYPSSLAAVI